MIWIILVCSAVYLIRGIAMIYGDLKGKLSFWGKEPSLSSAVMPFVSVIVPSRNEEGRIENCLNSLMQSNYPRENFEVIAVNDRSSDKTGEIIDGFAIKYPNIKVVHITSDAQKNNLRGKPGAISAGIKAAKGKYYLFTDADCLVHKNWIATIASTFVSKKADLVNSFTVITGNKVFDKIQNLEWLYLHTMAAALSYIKYPAGCYGNNMAVRKSTYEAIGGYESIAFSVTEDLALQQEIFRRNLRAEYICSENAAVHSLPVTNLREYISQHRRWAIGGLSLGAKAGVFVATSLCIWIALILSIFSGFYLVAALIFAGRLILDSALILSSALRLKETGNLAWMIPANIFFMLMELIIPVLVIDRKVKWKGQVFK